MHLSGTDLFFGCHLCPKEPVSGTDCILFIESQQTYSHSIVAGGLELMS